MKNFTDEQFHSYIDSAPDDATRYARMLEYVDVLREWGDDTMAVCWEWIVLARKKPTDDGRRYCWHREKHTLPHVVSASISTSMFKSLKRKDKAGGCCNYGSRIEAEIDLAQCAAKQFVAIEAAVACAKEYCSGQG